MFDAEGAQNVQPTRRQTRHGGPAPSKAQDIINRRPFGAKRVDLALRKNWVALL
jgi:hypothetical protein